jgi:hypothetical protein
MPVFRLVLESRCLAQQWSPCALQQAQLECFNYPHRSDLQWPIQKTMKRVSKRPTSFHRARAYRPELTPWPAQPAFLKALTPFLPRRHHSSHGQAEWMLERCLGSSVELLQLYLGNALSHCCIWHLAACFSVSWQAGVFVGSLLDWVRSQTNPNVFSVHFP